MTRRSFLTTLPAAGLLPPLASSFVQTPAAKPATLHSAFPSQDPARAREFVGACHGNLAKVREMLKESPKYALAVTDWGFGDWESALGAASHVGNPEIATLLIENGARPDLFYHAMMGHLIAIKALVSAQPGIQRTLGPHGITLLEHARAGGDAAKETLAYLESLGDADPRRVSLPVADADKPRYLGRYKFGPGDGDAWIVELGRAGDLRIKRGPAGNQLVLHRVEEHGFATPGNREMRIRFRVEGEQAVAVGVFDPDLVLEAKRA